METLILCLTGVCSQVGIELISQVTSIENGLKLHQGMFRLDVEKISSLKGLLLQ